MHRRDRSELRVMSINRLTCVLWTLIAFASHETRQSSVIIVRNDGCDPCYRKLMTGKRLADGHVRRNVQCSRIEDCHRVCEYESTFVCEGFNYGQMHNSGSVGRHVDRSYMCQLTSMSSTGMDVRRDFVQDPRYDYYERDWGCPASKTVQGTSQWSNDPRRPLWQPSGLSPSFERSPNEIFKRPQRPNDRYPSYANPGTNTRYYISEKPGQTIDRPNYHDYHSRPSNFPPQKPQTDVVNYHRPSEPLRPPPYLRNPDYHYPEYTHFQTRPVSQFPDRRYDQNSWHRPQQDTRPNEIPPDRNWHKPGGHYLPTKDLPDSGFYGSSYGYDSNRYDGRLPHRENGVRPGNFYSGHDKTRPSESPERPGDQPIDQGYNYGPAYGYDGHGQPTIQPIDSYGPRWKPQHHVQQSMGQGGWGGSRDCSVRSATGFKIVRTIVDASYTTGNLEECEMLCASRKDCRSFAYRYSLAATTPTDNCLLSTVDFSKLHFYTDLEPDRDYDIYAILGDPRNCKVTKKGGTDPQSNRRLPEECFWRMRSGFGMPDRLTRKELRVDHGLGECQIACVSVREFTCRSFVFRYESDQDRGSNCFLSDCPSSEIISENGARLPRIDQAELYERGSYGRGCEPYPFATIYNPANFDKPKPWTGGSNNVDNGADEGCYSGYQGGCRLSPYAVSSITRVDSETECRRKCSRMRNNPHTPCMSFSFKIGDEKRGDNCYLSDVLRKDLRPGLDYVSDDDYVMYAWKELEPQCSLFPADNPHNGGFYNDFAEGNSGSWSSGTATEGRPPPLGPVTGLFNYNHLVLGVRPLDSDRPDPVGPTDHLPHPVAPQNDDVHFPGLGPFNPDGFASFNRHYTVNGQPCKRGTKCERNQLVGFWSCEPEDSELGSWDYCCEPNHHCGFSEGFRYPWCYVGPSEDQWRPCSDKYFPYLPSPRPAIRPNQPDLHRPPYQLPGQTVDNQDSTTYHSRHWPIAYLHPQPPPNTTDSVALADDRRDDAHQTNESKDQPLTNKTRASVNETTNSPITHLQLHKSHLKRRGLVPANGTQSFSKYGVKKIRRITIIPPDRVLDLEPEVPFHNSRSVTAKPLASIESSYENGTPRTSSTNDGFEVIHLGATLPAVGSPKKRKGVLGRVERVTMSTRTITIDPQKREIKERTQRDIFSKDFGVIPNSADESSVYVPVPLTFHASNGSSRGSRTV